MSSPLLSPDEAISGNVREYLDRAIVFWRGCLKTATSEWDMRTAECYIDAFQSVRTSLLGETLP